MSRTLAKFNKITPRQATNLQPSGIVLMAQSGIMPSHVARAVARTKPLQISPPKIPPFTMTQIANIRPFNLVESRKIFKASLFSRAGVNDIGRSSYQK